MPKYSNGVYIDGDGGLLDALLTHADLAHAVPLSQAQLHCFYRSSDTVLHARLLLLQGGLGEQLVLHPSGPATESLPNAADACLLVRASAAVAGRLHKKSVTVVYRQDRWFAVAAEELRAVARDSVARLRETTSSESRPRIIDVQLCEMRDDDGTVVATRFCSEVLGLQPPPPARPQPAMAQASSSSSVAPVLKAKSAPTVMAAKPRACTVAGCSEVFPSISACRLHVKTHSLRERQPLVCTSCPVRFATAAAREQHVRMVHGPPSAGASAASSSLSVSESPMCGVAGCTRTKAFATVVARDQHVLSKHSAVPSEQMSVAEMLGRIFWIGR